MWVRDGKRIRKKIPKKSRLFRKCARRSWRKLFPLIFRLLLHFSSFGVTLTLLVWLRPVTNCIYGIPCVSRTKGAEFSEPSDIEM